MKGEKLKFNKKEWSVTKIDRSETVSWIKGRHYAKRMPSITYAFGLFKNGIINGVCTFGTPPSHTLLKGIAGEKWKKNVIELNRLTCVNIPNAASFLVGRSLRLLPKPSIVVSYADTKVNHIGYVYQACNFIYTGTTKPILDPMVKGLEHQHHATYAHGLNNQQLIEKFGDLLYWKQRSIKHRYIKIIAIKKQNKEILKDFKYETFSYPKGIAAETKFEFEKVETQTYINWLGEQTEAFKIGTL